MKVYRLRNPFQEIVDKHAKLGHVKTYSREVSEKLNSELADVFEKGRKEAARRQQLSWYLLGKSLLKKCVFKTLS